MVGDSASLFPTARPISAFTDISAPKRRKEKADAAGTSKKLTKKAKKQVRTQSTESVTGTEKAPDSEINIMDVFPTQPPSPQPTPALEQFALQPREPAKFVQVSSLTHHYEGKSKGLNFDPSLFVVDDEDDEDDDDEEAILAKVSKPITTAPTSIQAIASAKLSPSTIEKLKILVDALKKNADALLQDPSPIHRVYESIDELLHAEVNQAILAACDLDQMKTDVSVARERLAHRAAQKTLLDELEALTADTNTQHEKFNKLASATSFAKSEYGASILKVTELEKVLEEAKADRDLKKTNHKDATTAMKKQKSIVKSCCEAVDAHQLKIVEVPGTEEDDLKILDKVQSVLARADHLVRNLME